MTASFSVFTSNAGHSAKSPGASGSGFKEHEQARLCNHAFIKIMKSHGYTVIDTTSDGKNKYTVLQEQVAKANQIHAGTKQLDISFHLNETPGGTGVEVYYYSDNAKTTAAAVSKAISTTLGIRDRGAKQNKELYFLKHTRATAILIEICFIDNASDMQKLVNKRTEAMEAVAETLIGPFFSSTEVSTPSTSSYKGSSLVDYLKSIGVDSSFSNRTRLAISHSICKTAAAYTGSAKQNSALLKAMRGF